MTCSVRNLLREMFTNCNAVRKMSEPKQLSDGRREAIWSAAAPEVTSLQAFRFITSHRMDFVGFIFGWNSQFSAYR